MAVVVGVGVGVGSGVVVVVVAEGGGAGGGGVGGGVVLVATLAVVVGWWWWWCCCCSSSSSSSGSSFVAVWRRRSQLEGFGIVSASASPGRSKGARRHRRLAKAMEAATFKPLFQVFAAHGSPEPMMSDRSRLVVLFWAEAASFAGGGLPRAAGTDPQRQ